MASLLDTSKQIVDKDGKPTAYFEDIIAQLVLAVGGEGAPTVPEQIMAAEDPVTLARVRSL